MGEFPMMGYQTFSTIKRSTLKSEYQSLVQQYPDADAKLKQLLKVLGGIEDVAGYTPVSVGESAELAVIVNAAEENCKALLGDLRFSALYGTYE
jgi:hypothetical protein